MQLLLEYGADPNCKGPFPENVETPITIACRDLRWDTARELLKHGADVNAGSDSGMTPLLLAAFHNNPEMADTLLYQGARTDVQERGNGWSPLMYAVFNGNLPMVRSLLKAHANPNLKSNTGAGYETPLAYARRNYRGAAAISLLEQAGARR